MVMIGILGYGLDFVSGGLTQLQSVRRMVERVGRRILQKSKNYLRSGT